jgi:hypothetical protein
VDGSHPVVAERLECTDELRNTAEHGRRVGRPGKGRGVLIELLYFEGCPHVDAFVPRLRGLLAEAGIDQDVQMRRVESMQDAERERFLGSPTLRVNGHDVDPGADDRDDFGLKCRLYRTPSGMAGIPPDEWVVSALRTATDGPGG